MPAPVYQGFPMLGRARAQVWSYSPLYRRPRHFHAEPELNLIAEGTAVFGIGEGVIHVGPGELLWFPPGQDHALLSASPDLVLYAIGMQACMSNDVLRSRADHVLGAPVRIHLAGAQFKLLLSRTAAVAQQDGVDGQIAELWEAIHRLRCCPARSDTDRRTHFLTRRALATLNACPELQRSEVARKSSACPSEVSRHFHRDLGITLVQYRTRLRLLRFIELVDRRLSFARAALDAGFGSYSQCHRAFVATLGCGPRRFFGSNVRARMENRFLP